MMDELDRALIHGILFEGRPGGAEVAGEDGVLALVV